MSFKNYKISNSISGCVNDPMGSMCFGVCFQSRIGHIAQDGSTSDMMQFG